MISPVPGSWRPGLSASWMWAIAADACARSCCAVRPPCAACGRCRTAGTGCRRRPSRDRSPSACGGADRKKPGMSNGVDRLDQQPDAVPSCSFVGGKAQVLDERRPRASAASRPAAQCRPGNSPAARRAPSAYSIALPTPSRNSSTRSGMAGDAALARVPVAGRQVVQHQLEAVVVQRARPVCSRRIRIREQELDAAEARLGRGLEAFEKRHSVNSIVRLAANLACLYLGGFDSGGVARGLRSEQGDRRSGAWPRGASVAASSSNSLTPSISVPIEMLVTRSRMTSITTGT